MNNTSKVIVGIIALLVIVGGAFILFKPSKSNAPGNSSQSTTGSSDHSSDHANTTNTGSDDTPAAVTITYNGSSFSLSADTIKAGESIKVVNNSDKELSFDSDPHPVHTDNPELNVGDVAAGQSKTAKLTTKGRWGFHNHLNSSQHGNITVE